MQEQLNKIQQQEMSDDTYAPDFHYWEGYFTEKGERCVQGACNKLVHVLEV